MERRTIINYNWQPCGDETEVNPVHIEALEEEAEARVAAMSKEGFVAGELYANIRVDGNDPEDGVDYSGWWSITRE